MDKIEVKVNIQKDLIDKVTQEARRLDISPQAEINNALATYYFLREQNQRGLKVVLHDRKKDEYHEVILPPQYR